MANWEEITRELERLLRLRTFPIAYKRLEKVEELEKVPKVRKLDRFFTFCQLPTLVRSGGWTVGVTRAENMNQRCGRIHGLRPHLEEELHKEASMMGRVWYKNAEDAPKQVFATPRIPAGEAIVLAPLAAGKFDPDVVLIYGTPAQVMMLMCALQWEDYERLHFSFTGEGACADALAQCYISGKPSLGIPCYGERRFGHVADDELVLAVPGGMMEKLVEGLRGLYATGIRYPIALAGAELDPLSLLARPYPELLQQQKE